MAHEPIDYQKLAHALLQSADRLVSRWLPAGIERNGRWYVGDFDGGSGESANVNLKTGQWIDNAAPDDEKGGDLISLYARIRGLSQAAAALELMRDMGWTAVQTSAPSPMTKVRRAPPPDQPSAAAPAEKRRSMWTPIVPVPAIAAPPARFLWRFHDRKADRWIELEAVRTWEYVYDGVRYGYVCRFERTSSDGELVKDTLPLTWCVDESDGQGTQKWHWKGWEAPRPLYVPAGKLRPLEDKIPVVLVEGEKCADAGHLRLGDRFDFVSWPGGCKTWSYALWLWLQGRFVILWPDCDAQRERLTKLEKEAGIDPGTKPLRDEALQPGMQAMVGVGTELAARHACVVTICRIPKPGAVTEGWDIADAIDEGWDDDRLCSFLLNAKPFEATSDEARAKIRGEAPPPPSDAGASGDEEASVAWRRYLVTSAQGAIKPARENVVLALDGMPEKGITGIAEAHGVIAFNDFTNDVVKLKPAPWGAPAGVWNEVEDLLMGNWLLHEHYLPSMSRQTLEEAVRMVAHRRRYHPLREQLEAIQGRWDGERRLGTWLRRACLVEDEYDEADPLQQYLSRVGAWLIMAICARVLTPGCKFDYMVIFEGAQGVGKSTLARILGGDFFADTGLVLGDKDSYQNLQGISVYEWGELDSLNKSEVTKVKQFISSMTDRFRASFDRRPKDYPRQVVFIGTTNEDHYLTDPTGNRRFWPVRVTRVIDVEWLRQNREQLFAEALHYLKEGHRFFPNAREQRDLFEPQQQQRAVESAIESSIARYLYDETVRPNAFGENGSMVQEISLVDLLGRIGIGLEKLGPGRFHEKQAAAALRRLGWLEGRSSAPGRPRVYRRPPTLPSSPPSAPTRGSDSSTRQPQGAHTSGVTDDCPF